VKLVCDEQQNNNKDSGRAVSKEDESERVLWAWFGMRVRVEERNQAVAAGKD
jgi:hypothetical protein